MVIRGVGSPVFFPMLTGIRTITGATLPGGIRDDNLSTYATVRRLPQFGFMVQHHGDSSAGGAGAVKGVGEITEELSISLLSGWEKSAKMLNDDPSLAGVFWKGFENYLDGIKIEKQGSWYIPNSLAGELFYKIGPCMKQSLKKPAFESFVEAFAKHVVEKPNGLCMWWAKGGKSANNVIFESAMTYLLELYKSGEIASKTIVELMGLHPKS